MGGKVLVVGSGGREHATATKLAESPLVETVYADADWSRITPKCIRYRSGSNEETVGFAAENKADLIIVGPEMPLAQGIKGLADKKGLRLFGPGTGGMRLETSKCDANDFMTAYNIPNSNYRNFSWLKNAINYIDHEWHGPVWVIADGLAAGKGAIQARTQDEAREAVNHIMHERKFGEAGSRITIEDHLEGEEASCTVMINSLFRVAAPLIFAEDHKRVFDGDTGPNTGGMGAYAPTTLVTNEIAESVMERIVIPTINGLGEERIHDTGFLYPGLMINNGTPVVVEFNRRLGDPEAQPLAMLADFDWYEAMQNVIDGKKPELKWKPGYAVCVILASGGYPGEYETGKQIHGLRERDNVVVFHAGTRYEGGWRTSGGRVLGITAYGKTIGEALGRAYAAIGQEKGGIYFDGMHFRRDIGQRELRRCA